MVPVSSVLTAPDGSTSVMVAGSDSRAHQTAVKVGIRNGDDVQIVEGVKENDKVVSIGAYGLPDKTRIKIEAAEEGEPSKPAPGGSKGATEDASDK